MYQGVFYQATKYNCQNINNVQDVYNANVYNTYTDKKARYYFDMYFTMCSSSDFSFSSGLFL